MDPDKRESPRTEILGRLAGEVSVPAPAIIRSISRKGAQIECAFPLILAALTSSAYISATTRSS